MPELVKAANYCVTGAKSGQVKLDEVLLFIQMLRFRFPGGDFLSTPQNLQHLENEFSCFKGTDLSSYDQASIRLVSRVFAFIESTNDKEEGLSQLLDFDVSQFSCLLSRVRFTLNSVAQAALFRTFLQGKSTLANQNAAMNNLSFSKRSNGLAAIAIKHLLITENFEEAGRLTGSQDRLRETLERGAHLFAVLRAVIKYAFEKIESSTKRKQYQDNVFADLKTLFDTAHFLMVGKLKGNAAMANAVAALESADTLLPSGNDAVREAGIDGASSQ